MIKPNAATLRAMRQARSIVSPRFSSAKELFDELEKSPDGKRNRVTAKKRVQKRG
jgi:hypothetical protein